MPHIIQAFIGKRDAVKKIVNPLAQTEVTIVELPQNFDCLFLCDNLQTAIHRFMKKNESEVIAPFDFFSSAMQDYIECVGIGDFIYIETEYFGGEGSQCAGVFKDGKLLKTYRQHSREINPKASWPKRVLNSPINSALRELGVIRNAELDEFDTMDLGNYRSMPR